MSADTVLATFNNAIDIVLAQPVGAKRWRAANDLWLTLSPKNRQLYDAVVRENAQVRESLGTFNKFAVGDEKNLRRVLNVPTGAYYAIQRADPDVFTRKANAAKFFKEFKEYTTAEIY
jgi:hypothetical protein